MDVVINKTQYASDASMLRREGLKAHKRSNTVLRDIYLRQAAERYRIADLTGMAQWCERFLGTPA
jgi:hypothetical protein